MKYTQMLDMNMVPEWRNQYLDYQGLDATLNKAIESKNMKARDKSGVDSYFNLIKFNQKFANFFNHQCQDQLDKIETFHREKLSEMRGKFNNLQDQLEQVLSSAVYRDIQPDYCNQTNQSRAEQTNVNYTTISSISDLFKNIKNSMGASRGSVVNNNAAANYSIGCLKPKLLNNETDGGRLSVASLLGFGDRGDSRRNSNFKAGREKVCVMVRKLSENISSTSAKQLANRIFANNPYPMDSNGRLGAGPTEVMFFQDQDQIEMDMETKVMDRETLAGANPQSKKRMVACYRKKLRNLKFAFRELYFNLVLFEQYTQLNHSGFEQILRKHDRMFASTFGRKFYQEHVQTADFHNNLHEIDQLLEKVEHVFTLHFENGNRRKAIEKLQVPTSVYRPTSPMLDFRVGYELGMFSILFCLVLLVGFIIHTGYDWRTVFRLYRSPLMLIIFLFQTGISIIIWKHYKINHVLIFELNPRNNLSYQHFIEFASQLGMIWSISVLLFLFSAQLGIKPSICPLVVVVMIAIYLFNPTQTCHHRSRFWLLRILARIFTAPFHPVRVADFWIADQLVSIVPFFLDLEYLCCFYTTGDVLSVSYLSSDYANRCVTSDTRDLVLRTIVAALPAWFRCAQCLRRWHDENWLRLHLANAGKYSCMVLVVVLSSISQYNKSTFDIDTTRIIWMMAAIFTSSLTAYWDIIYDFGLFNKYDKNEENDDETSKPRTSRATSSIASDDSSEFYNKLNKRKDKTYPFLRKELVYPAWIYYFAIVENIILRFGWIITISLTEFSGIEAGLVVSLLAPMEMFRRFVWNCIRLENEQLNNCGLFRAVRDIPIEVVAPIDESHLDKVIMMMDSRDGPSMRNRLMKRRTLRPDRVSFMVLENSSNDTTRRSNIRLKY